MTHTGHALHRRAGTDRRAPRPTSAHTFRDYVSQHLVPFVESQVTPTVTRVDAVWVTYPEDNLKTLTPASWLRPTY